MPAVQALACRERRRPWLFAVAGAIFRRSLECEKITGLSTANVYDGVSRVAQALASGTRLKTLELLAQRERAVQELSEAAGLSVTTASAHLQVLREAGLVTSRRADLSAALPLEGIRLMSRAELLAASRDGEVVVLDVRPADEFAAGHLSGAVSIPLSELADRLGEIPADTEVVAYCRGRYCVLSHDAVRLLEANGVSARLAQDGVAEWLASGVELVTGNEP
jgi:DNA-binding transcriptional ArsR family regulator